MVSLDDPVNRRQAQAGAFSLVLGGKEGLPDFFQNLGWNTSSGIPDIRPHVVTGIGLGLIRQFVFLQDTVGRFDP